MFLEFRQKRFQSVGDFYGLNTNIYNYWSCTLEPTIFFDTLLLINWLAKCLFWLVQDCSLLSRSLALEMLLIAAHFELPVYINTSPASPASPERDKCVQALLWRRRSVFKYFSGAGEVLLIWCFSGAEEAWELFKNTFPAPEKYLYTLFRRWRSAYIGLHLSGAREAGEVFIYTTCNSLLSSFILYL